jgi:thioredoxin 1
MKKKIAIILSSVLALSACSSASATDLSAQEFQAKTQENGVVTLDVRSPGEFMEGHLVNSINIDVENPSFLQKLKS